MKKISHIFTLMLFYFCCLIANSQEKQEIKILDFKQVSNFHIDYAKEFAYQESNRDSTIWALLIVETNDPNIRVISSESNPGHYVWEELRKNPRFDINEHRMPGEIWYSLRPGAKQFRVAHSLYRHDTDIPALYNREGKHIGRLISNWYIPPSKMLGEYGLVEAGKTYRLKIEVPQTFSAPDKDADPGFVTFSTDPVGALVTLMKNGEVKASGKTNPDYSFSLSYGEYMYVVSAENHHSASGTIRVGETPTTRSIKLRPITGKLTVMSSPSGADVIIGGKKYGVTPLNIDSLVVGEHEVTIGKVGYGEVKEKVVVAENKRASINAQITSGNEMTPTRVGTLTPQWAPGVTEEQKRILTELIESMVMVEGGTFTMGATSEQVSSFYNEKPTHRVTLSDYYIGAYEVTQEQWQAVMGKNPSSYKGSRKPVECVSWNDCQEFIKKLNSLTGLNFALPTEAQWEYATRGGNKSRGYKYSGGNDLYSVGWFGHLNTYGDNKGNSGGETHPVGQKAPNELGLYDMSGNVWEWCQDWYGDYSSSSQTDPTGPSTGSYRVVRGGECRDGEWLCRVSNRIDNDPGRHLLYDGSSSGLRLAINIDENSDVNHDEVVSIPGGLMPRWSSSATAEQRRIIGELIESMVMVEGGTFTMGATSEQGSDADNDEKPTHRVTLSDYYIGAYEVTQEQWQAVMGSNPLSYKGSRKPVETVSWNDCQEFIKKLNSLTGLNFALPTEAQWEYAARGGNKSRGYKYSGSNNLSSVAWYDGSGGAKEVGQKQANELGLYDMSGNVWEWCSDWYGSSYYSSSPSTDPTGPSTGSYRVARGGGWYRDARSCRVSYRFYDTPDGSGNYLGLRLVASQF